MKWALRASTAILLTAGLALGGYILHDRATQPAPADPAPLLARAKSYDVQIRRDQWGVPHILGKRDADAAFGLAFAHAEDDFETLQQVTLAVRGTLAEQIGRKAAVTDYLVRLLRVWETVNARYETDLPPDLRAVIEAYADGINYYAALHPAEVAPTLLPVTGRDIAAGFVFKTPFFYGLDKALMRLTSAETTQQAENARKSAWLLEGPREAIGSNGVAASPRRTPDGATRLLVNSHQPYSGPVAWYQAVVESGEGWHVDGGFFPGTPFMLHGHNEHLGWANTVDEPRLFDIYALKLNPADENQYWLDGKWQNFEITDAALRVKIWGPLVWTAYRPVLWSAHGPVLKTATGAYALRYAGMDEIRQVLEYYRLDKARNLDEFKAALGLQALPSINYIYADEHGNIGYVYNGLFPRRKPGLDPWKIQPGDDSSLIWHGYQPFAQIPQLFNPASGLVFNSNNTPFHASLPADDIDPSKYGPEWGIQTNMTNRAWRALETFGAQAQLDDAAFRAAKFDLRYSTHSEMAEVLREVAALDSSQDPSLKSAQTLLAGWNLSTDQASRAAALAVLTARPVIEARMEGHSQPSVVEALHGAINTLQTHFGRIDPPWGSVNRIRRGTTDLPIDGGPDIFRAVYGDLQPDGTLTGMAGDTLIMFVTWDKDGSVHADSINQFGASNHPNSPHYADQTKPFANMQTHPTLFTEAELAPHITTTYHPGAPHP